MAVRASFVVVGALVVAACDGGSGTDDTGFSPFPCATPEVGLEVAPPDGGYGDLSLGGDLWVGLPPQGGAPYTPLRLRVSGPGAFYDGVNVDIDVTEEGTLLAETSLPMRLVCANVGENAGHWVGAEVHLRWFGLALDELAARNVRVTVSVSADSEPSVVATSEGDVITVID